MIIFCIVAGIPKPNIMNPVLIAELRYATGQIPSFSNEFIKAIACSLLPGSPAKTASLNDLQFPLSAI
jgi:hypothetical protein